MKSRFLLALLSSDRPISEILAPTMLDQRKTFENHFAGMTLEKFSYDEFDKTRESLVKTIHTNLTSEDREFILSVKRLEPQWDTYNFEQFPAVQWKLQNLRKLRENNEKKHSELLSNLKKTLANKT